MQSNQPNDGNGTSRTTCSPIVDLRQYTLYPGTRDGFVELFDREFVETQEASGMRVIGQFRDLGDPNRFVWLRGFSDMPSRQKALTDFYLHGAAWRTHSEVARSKMIDSTDALLLRPARADSGFSLEPPDRRPALDAAVPQGIIVAAIYSLSAPPDADFLAFFEGTVGPVLRDAGATILASFVTEYSRNNFPRLQLREGENVFRPVRRLQRSRGLSCAHDRARTEPALARRGRARADAAHPRTPTCSSPRADIAFTIARVTTSSSEADGASRLG
jgi:hypothetical protein